MLIAIDSSTISCGRMDFLECWRVWCLMGCSFDLEQLPFQSTILARTRTRCWEHPNRDLLLPLWQDQPTRRFTNGSQLFPEWGRNQHSTYSYLQSRMSSKKFILFAPLSLSLLVLQCRPGWGYRRHRVQGYRPSKQNPLVQVETNPTLQYVQLICEWSVLMITSYARYSSHDLVNIHLAIVEVFRHWSLIENFFNIFHCVSARIWWDWSWLSHRINMSHISYGGCYKVFMISDKVIDFFISGVWFGYEVIFIFIGIVRSTYVQIHLYQSFRSKILVCLLEIWSASFLNYYIQLALCYIHLYSLYIWF